MKLCSGLISNQTAESPYSVPKLLKKLTDSKIQIRNLEVAASVTSELNSLVFETFYEGYLASSVHLSRIGKNAYESHSEADEKFQGKGLGSLNYVISAIYAARELNAEVYSSLSPSEDARRTWNRLVKAGWAKAVSDPFPTTSYSGRSSSRFVIKKELIEKGVFDELNSLILKPDLRLVD